MSRRLRVLVWQVNRGWLASFVRGDHEYLLPGGRGAAWPPSVRHVPTAELARTDVDVVVLQRPEELGFATRLLGRVPGRDVPAIYVEHTTPRGDVPDTRHPLADRVDLSLVHVTHFNELMWDCGTTPTTVIEHGIADPGELYTGELPRAAVVLGDAIRRWRAAGTDLLPRFAEGAELDVFGTGLDELNRVLGIGEHRLFVAPELPRRALHEAMARRRVYVHPARWSTLGMSLIEAMQLGMPVVALASTEVIRAVPAEAGVVSTVVDELTSALRELIHDPAKARQMGKHAREFALGHYGLSRFLRRWDDLIRHVAR
jgi:hypothetical protein